MKMVPLGEVVRVVSGATPKTGEPKFWDGDVEWATPADLSKLDGPYISDTPRKITPAGVRSCATTVLPPGSVLLSSRAPIGHVAINTVPMATNQGFKSLVPGPDVHAKYLYHWLSAKTEYLQSLGNGATFKELSKRTAEQIHLPLPPLDEQRRIAAILDHADAFRAKRRQVLTHVNSLTQSIFHDMFSGWRWPEALLETVVRKGTVVTYGIVQAGDEVTGGVPYIRTGDLVDGKIDVDRLRHTSPDIARRFERSRLQEGDIVMSIRATVGTTAVVPPQLAGANLTQGTARISPGEHVRGPYLLGYLRSELAQRWIRSRVKGATFREITLGRLRELPVPVPPAKEQEEYGTRIEYANAVYSRAVGALAADDELFASLQSRAFRGEL